MQRRIRIAGTVVSMVVGGALPGWSEPAGHAATVVAQELDNPARGGPGRLPGRDRGGMPESGGNEQREPRGMGRNPAGQVAPPAPHAAQPPAERPVQRMVPEQGEGARAVPRMTGGGEEPENGNRPGQHVAPGRQQRVAPAEQGGGIPAGAGTPGEGERQMRGGRRPQPSQAPEEQQTGDGAPSQRNRAGAPGIAPSAEEGAPGRGRKADQPRGRDTTSGDQSVPRTPRQAVPAEQAVPAQQDNPVPRQQRGFGAAPAGLPKGQPEQGTAPSTVPNGLPLPRGKAVGGGAPQGGPVMRQPGAPQTIPPGQPENAGGQPARTMGGAPGGRPGGFPPPPPPPVESQAGGGQRREGGRGGAGAAAAAGVAAGFAGGFLAAQGVDRLDEVRRHRQEMRDNGVNIIREPGRTIVEEDNQTFIAHDENQRFRDLGYDIRTERQGAYSVDYYDSPDGSRIYTYTDAQGRLVRRVRQYPDGRQIFLIDNRYAGPDRDFRDDVVDLPPPPVTLPPDQYVVDADNANEDTVYDALVAPPVAALPQRYTLDQVRYSVDLRARMRSVDLNTINFATGSWDVTPEQGGRLAVIARAIARAVQRNPQEVFMVEGYTDAVGSPIDNLSLSDRRAQSVASILTRTFQVPAENLVTQGYGAQFLKVNTQAANAENRRVTVRRITPLLSQR